MLGAVWNQTWFLEGEERAGSNALLKKSDDAHGGGGVSHTTTVPWPLSIVLSPESMAYHPRVPSHIRWGMLALLSFNLGLFLWGYFPTRNPEGATVELILATPNREIVVPLFGFSLKGSIEDMWGAKLYPLAILIAFWSGGWPYLKCILLMGLWFISSERLSPTTRGKVYHCLDLVHKWRCGFVRFSTSICHLKLID